MTIGEKIRVERKAAKMSQKDLSEKSGLAMNTISRYENGERLPNIEALMKIANALCIDIYELTNGIEIPGIIISRETYKNDSKNNVFIDNCLKQILLAYDKLNATGKETAAQHVQELTMIEQYTEPDGQEPPF